MAYATYMELRTRINKTVPNDDTVLTALLDAATRNIDRACRQYHTGREFFNATTASARVFAGTGAAFQWIDPCVSVTTVAVKTSYTESTYTAWAATDWLACSGSLQHPNFNDTPYSMLMVTPTGNYAVFTSGRAGGANWTDPVFSMSDAAHIARGGIGHAVPTVRVTATWGYSATPPPDIREACLMQSTRWWKRYESAMSDTLASGELGQLLYRQALDPDIRRILVDGGYVKPAVGRRS